MITVTIHEGPDKDGKYLYTRTWDDENSAFCMTCGADPSRNCKCFKDKTQRGQVFRAVHPTQFFINREHMKIVDARRGE